MVEWPFKRLSDLQLRDQKVTLNHLADCIIFSWWFSLSRWLFCGRSFFGDHSGLDTSGLNGHSGFSTAKNLEDESWSLYIKMPSVIKVISKYTDWNLRWLLKMMVTLAQRYIYIPVSPVSPLFYFAAWTLQNKATFFQSKQPGPHLGWSSPKAQAAWKLWQRSSTSSREVDPAGPQRMGTFHHQLRTPETN